MDKSANSQGSRALMAAMSVVTADTTEMILYRFYDRDGALLYVGITNNMNLRQSQHRTKPWFPMVSVCTEEKVTGRQKATYLEARAIESEKPLFNRQHNGRRTSWL